MPNSLLMDRETRRAFADFCSDRLVIRPLEIPQPTWRALLSAEVATITFDELRGLFDSLDVASGQDLLDLLALPVLRRELA